MRVMCKFTRAAASIITLATVALSPVSADQEFYRCVVNGKTTYMDKPCDAPKPLGVVGPSRSTSGDATGDVGKLTRSIELDYSTPYGVWRGQAQYQGTTAKGQAMPEAHVVVPLLIEVEKQGRVRGSSPENGCKLLGVAAPYVAPNILRLDVALTECRYPGLNRRYSGMLTLNQSSNLVQFSLRSLNPMVAVLIEGPSNFDIKATMKR